MHCDRLIEILVCSPQRYEEPETEATIAAILTAEGFQETTDGPSNSAVGLILDRTPFYAEQGGQVADIGRISSTSGVEYFEVQDTQVKPFLSLQADSPHHYRYTEHDCLCTLTVP